MQQLLRKASKKQSTEFGLLLILVVLARAFFAPDKILVAVAFVLALLTMLFPLLFRPFAALWYALSRLLNAFSTSVLMTIVFFAVVVPIGLLRRWAGSDPLKIRQFKKDRTSVMITRDHLFTKKDLENTF